MTRFPFMLLFYNSIFIVVVAAAVFYVGWKSVVVEVSNRAIDTFIYPDNP